MASLLLLFASNQHLLVPAMWKAIEAIGGDELAAKVLRHVSGTLAEHYRRRITGQDPTQRLRQLAEILREEGGLVELPPRPAAP